MVAAMDETWCIANATEVPHRRAVARVLGRVTACVAAVVAFAVWTPTAMAAQWTYHDHDSDALWDTAAIDRDYNGTYDDLSFDLDNDGSWDSRLYNTRYSDALLEALDYDGDENAEVEIRLLDGDQRVGFDYVYFDLDQNGYWDRWRGYRRAIIPRSNVDNIRRSNRQNASSRLIHNFRMRTGMSLLYPNIPAGY